jgi:hypothetical protein
MPTGRFENTIEICPPSASAIAGPRLYRDEQQIDFAASLKSSPAMCGVPPDAAPNVSCGTRLGERDQVLDGFYRHDGWITITSGDTAISVTPTKSRTVS